MAQCRALAAATCACVPQETAEERWRPILGVEQVLVSVISMLADPNTDSPANVDAAVCAARARARAPT